MPDTEHGSIAPVDVIILAGTHQERDKLIHGQNKAFLDLHGKPVVQWVLEAISQAKHVGRIVIVGPLEKILLIREQTSIDFIPVEQRGQMITNAWAAFHALCSARESYPSDFIEYQAALEAGTFKHPEAVNMEQPYLFISGDVPLVVPEAIDDFIEQCAPFDQDMYYGVCNETSLRPYYPGPQQIGIRRPYVNFAEDRVRVANIQIVKPLKLGRLYLIQAAYSVRKLVKWRNIVRMLLFILRLPYGLTAAGYVIMLQISSLLNRYGLGEFAGPIVRRTHQERMTWYLSKFLHTRFVLISSPFGGLSIDIDDADDYEIMKRLLVPWREIQQNVATTLRVHEGSRW